MIKGVTPILGVTIVTHNHVLPSILKIHVYMALYIDTTTTI